MTYSSIFKSVAFGPKLYKVFTSYEFTIESHGGLISKMKRMVDYVTSILFDQYPSGGNYTSSKLVRNLSRNITYNNNLVVYEQYLYSEFKILSNVIFCLRLRISFELI